MRRREFVALLGGVTTAWPLVIHAQQPAIPVIGFLNDGWPQMFVNRVRAFREGLSEAGYSEGRNVAIEYRWAEGQYDRLPALASDLVRRQVDVITANGPAVLPAKAATTTIPIVFSGPDDPVKLGLVERLNRPGGNLTGVTTLNIEVGLKRLELLHEMIPAAKSIALLVNRTNPNAESQSRGLPAAANRIGVQLHVFSASTEKDLNNVFVHLKASRIGGLIIDPDPFFGSSVKLFAALTLKHGLPAIFQFREFPEVGGLMSYGGSFAEEYRILGDYTGKILAGARPSDLPVQQATIVELIVNLRTAKALGIEVPRALVARADEVIE